MPSLRRSALFQTSFPDDTRKIRGKDTTAKSPHTDALQGHLQISLENMDDDRTSDSDKYDENFIPDYSVDYNVNWVGEACCRFQYKTHTQELITELNSQRKSDKFVDVVVEVEGRQFPCHRAVLASTPYFKTMFSSCFTESDSKVVKLHEIDASSFSKILDFLYTGEVEISGDDVQDILQVAVMLQVEKVKEYCAEFMERRICPSNCLGVMQLADMCGLSALKILARNEALSNFSEIRHNEEFLSLTMQLLLDLLTVPTDENDHKCKKELKVASEEDILNSVLRWLEHSPESRKTATFTILSAVNLSRVRVSVLRKLESHPVIQESAECLAMITAAVEMHNNGSKQLTLAAEGDEVKIRPRCGISDDLAIIVGGWCLMVVGYPPFNKESLDVEPMPQQSISCIDPDTKQTYCVTQLPETLFGYMSIACAERCLYVTGGRVCPLIGQGPHSAPSRQAFRYNFRTDTWVRLPDMPRGRAEHQSAIVEGKLFLVGGDVETTSQLCMDCYDLEEEAWIKPPDLPQVPVMDMSLSIMATACGGKLVLSQLSKRSRSHYAAYSVDDDRSLSVHAFDVKNASWVFTSSDVQAPISFDDMDLSWIAVDDKVYFYTVARRSFKMYVYNVKEGTLSKVMGNQDFKGSFLHIHSDIPVIIRNKVEGNTRVWCPEIPLPFDVFGKSFLATTKSTVGWYSRDLTLLEDEEEEEEVDTDDEMSSASESP